MKAYIVPPPPKPDHTFALEFDRSELARLDGILSVYSAPSETPLGTFALQIRAEIDRLLKVPT